MSVLTLVALTQMFIGAWTAPPRSLGEVALREAARRASVSASVRTLTDADIGPPPVRAAAPPAVDPATQAAGVDATAGEAKAAEKKSGADAKPEEVRDEAWWRARMRLARESLDRDLLLITALESRVAALTTDVTNRDDPAQRELLMKERVRAVSELDRMREQVVLDRKLITAIEEDARKSGVPAAWIR